MSRLSGPEQIKVPPTNNVYTALVVVSVVVLIVGLLLLIMRHDTVFGVGFFSST
jgi:hypothetical protein